MFLTILITKLLGFLGGLIGRGSSLPGLIALKLYPGILGKLKLPDIVVAVTGSNGKTSTTELIRKVAIATGKRVVCNSEGSNQTEGVATALLKACSLTGKVNADIVVLESDERFCQYTFKQLAPSHIVVLNLYRDQLTRNGHSDFVKGELKKGLAQTATLILNADEPQSASLSVGRSSPVLWFGVSPDAISEKGGVSHAYDDGASCPVCRAPMTYGYRIQNHLGSFCCESCGFKHQGADHMITGAENGVYLIDGSYSVVPQLDNPMFAYNLAAAFTIAAEVFGLPGEEAAKALSGHELSNTFQARLSDFSCGGCDGTFFLCKHENSMAYDGAIEAICRSDAPQKTVVIAADLLSRKYIANDMSWLWDIDFERLNREDIVKFYVGGLFAYDVALRLVMAGIGPEKIIENNSISGMVDELRLGAIGHIFAMTCFTDSPKLLPLLKGEDR